MMKSSKSENENVPAGGVRAVGINQPRLEFASESTPLSMVDGASCGGGGGGGGDGATAGAGGGASEGGPMGGGDGSGPPGCAFATETPTTTESTANSEASFISRQ
jgi:hypothetical protein